MLIQDVTTDKDIMKLDPISIIIQYNVLTKTEAQGRDKKLLTDKSLTN